jgi:hypothetical protein
VGGLSRQGVRVRDVASGLACPGFDGTSGARGLDEHEKDLVQQRERAAEHVERAAARDQRVEQLPPLAAERDEHRREQHARALHHVAHGVHLEGGRAGQGLLRRTP